MPLTPSSILKELFPTDDMFLESLISFFYINYDKDLSSEDSRVFDTLQNLCNSPIIEAKLIDFSVAFLYSRDDFDFSIVAPFPHLTILRFDDRSLSSKEAYDIVSSNILDFLVRYIQTRKYLLLQPRIFFHQCELSSIREFKTRTRFLDRTCCLVSLYDLLVHLLEFHTNKQKDTPITKLRALDLETIAKQNQSKMMHIEKGEEFQQTIGVLSLKNSSKLLQMIGLKLALSTVPAIVFFGELNFFIAYVHDYVKQLRTSSQTSARLLQHLVEMAAGITVLI